MRIHNKPKLAAALVLSMVLLAGCTELPGKANRNEENPTEEQIDFGATLQREIGIAASGLEQTIETAALQISDNVISHNISQTLTASEQIGSSTVLHMDNPLGKIEVQPVAVNQMTVRATIWFDDSSSHEEARQQIMDNAEVSIQIKGDQLKVVTHAKGKSNKDIWSWAEDKLNYSNFSLDYIVEIPDSVEKYKITNNVGEIRLRDLHGTYQIVSNVGNVNISGARFTGKSTIESNTGSIQLDIAEMAAGSSLKAKTDVGSLNAVLSKSLQCNLVTKSELGPISGAASGESEINGGGPLLSLSSSIGAISVDQ